MMSDTKKDDGKNIRVPTKTWEKIRKHCFNLNISMGQFVAEVTDEKLKTKKSSFK